MIALYDIAAPAKLNLFLHVVGRRADGYHLLQSLFVLIDWIDTLHIERRNDGRLARHDLGARLPADDLCLRAARLLQARSGTAFGADISIDKQVPWGAGLGGGSSDAASTLLALNRLWALGWSRARLATLALELGADVPFFIGARHALVEGIGERLTPVALARRWLAVVKPPEGIETRAVFGSPRVERSDAADILARLSEAESTVLGPVVGFGRNDLQAAAIALCPAVDEAVRMLHAVYGQGHGQGGQARMTGSGSAVFAEAGFGDAPSAPLPDPLPPGWIGRMCRSLDVHPLAGWSQEVAAG